MSSIPKSPQSPLRVGVAGLGTVGASVVRIMQTKGAALARAAGRPLAVVAVSARDRSRDRGFSPAGLTFFDDPAALAMSEAIDVFVEVIGGADGPALAAVEAALATGKSVVTANKAMLAAHGTRLAALAEEKGAALLFEAAAGGGIPIVKTLRESVPANTVRRVSGILNGTCNYILTRMEREGLSFETVLADAQRLGYAEADPAADVEGHDTANKVALLAALAFGTRVAGEAIYVEGIANVTPLDIRMADELGFRIKLLGVAERSAAGIEQRVHPTFVPKSSPLAAVDGVTNAVAVETDLLGELVLVGPGAGGDATASAVIGDLVDVARACFAPAFGRPAETLETPVQAPIQRHEGGYYIRLTVFDRPGAAATIAGRMAERGISLESILQKGARDRADGASVPVVLITYATSEELIRAALAAIAAEGVLDGQPQAIRIDR